MFHPLAYTWVCPQAKNPLYKWLLFLTDDIRVNIFCKLFDNIRDTYHIKPWTQNQQRRFGPKDDDNFYLILQYCSKGQLYSILKKEGRLNERVAAQYLREVISACQYLHQMDPPIIHRDIKPENILLDSNNSVKLGDFGWSNFFNEDRRRLTYCGTPEYLAPEMIRQVGHDKSLDIWNLGVLMFELLTGSPPFEGANQNELFDNILKFKIKWPKGFPGVAKDLVTKLLKSNPQERISLDETLEHPWFQGNPAIRPVQPSIASAEPTKLPLEGDTMNYQVISKPSIVNKVENQSSETRQSIVIEKKIQQAAAATTESKEPQPAAEDLNTKYNQTKKELNEIKVNFHIKCKENESLLKENNELKDQLAQKNLYGSKDSVETKKLLEEIQKLRSLNKHRDEILNQMESQNKNQGHSWDRANSHQSRQFQARTSRQLSLILSNTYKFKDQGKEMCQRPSRKLAPMSLPLAQTGELLCTIPSMPQQEPQRDRDLAQAHPKRL